MVASLGSVLQGAISAGVRAAWKAARSNSRARIMDWLLKALPKGAKKVHSWLKHDVGEPPKCWSLLMEFGNFQVT
eukprot:5833352-Pyramimonas_sp.AAC.1